jgi:hypothetical protein
MGRSPGARNALWSHLIDAAALRGLSYRAGSPVGRCKDSTAGEMRQTHGGHPQPGQGVESGLIGLASSDDVHAPTLPRRHVVHSSHG